MKLTLPLLDEQLDPDTQSIPIVTSLLMHEDKTDLPTEHAPALAISQLYFPTCTFVPFSTVAVGEA